MCIIIIVIIIIIIIKGLKEEDWADRNNWRRKIA